MAEEIPSIRVRYDDWTQASDYHAVSTMQEREVLARHSGLLRVHYGNSNMDNIIYLFDFKAGVIRESATRIQTPMLCAARGFAYYCLVQAGMEDGIEVNDG